MVNDPSIPELEKRMRPGAYSQMGFLGQTESLEAVLTQDSQTLKALGVSHEQIALALEDVLQRVQDQKGEIAEKGYEEFRQKEQWGIPDLYHPQTTPKFSVDNLPDTGRGTLVGGKLQVFIAQYRGFQGCPWGCAAGHWASFDFLILNRESGKSVTGPGLIVHLIRQHHFFEGLQTPFRVDPGRVVEVLELAPQAGTG